ncbi:MAG TPA: flavodoxin domain-containing protein [Candidatus Limnocylindrales bacterium]|nr:flavodoxin domain-containing protein [Candidatus Limnocylindrales bacterium]
MTTVLVAYGSRHGATRGIAERIGEVLQSEGLDAVITAADQPVDVSAADAFVVGSGVYMGSWLKEPLEFMHRHQDALASHPTWLFSSGPLPGSSKETQDADPVTNALGPKDGPGSGGRRKVEESAAVIHPRGHEVFMGAFNPDDPPKAMSERFVRLMPISSKILPPGDFREWDAIEQWAREIAAALTPSPVG